MAQVARSDRCPCGSGKRTKRCCKLPAGPGPEDLARAELAGLSRTVVPVLRCCSCSELDRLLGRVSELPQCDPSLAWPLPRRFPPELEALRAAIDAADVDAVRSALTDAVAVLDTAIGRAHLARAVIALRDAGEVEASAAAAMVVDLASGSPQAVTASIVEAVVLDVGVPPDPARLVLSAS
jgi:hypothetical protein